MGPAVYSIDQNLKALTVRSTDTSRPDAWELRISSINDVYRDKDIHGHPTLKSMHGVASLSAAHRQQLVILLFTQEGGGDGFMGLLQADSQARDIFATSVNILRLYREVLTADLT